MLNNIVDNLEQCGQQNIVHGCFHQARTGCSFFAVILVRLTGEASKEELGVIKITELNKMAEGTTYYELLGVERNASEKEVVRTNLQYSFYIHYS